MKRRTEVVRVFGVYAFIIYSTVSYGEHKSAITGASASCGGTFVISRLGDVDAAVGEIQFFVKRSIWLCLEYIKMK